MLPVAENTRIYRRYGCLLLCIYCGVYGALLWGSSGIPYVFDNNESFSSLWHAINLDRFGISKSFGLTDESYSPNASGHPYVYTHQGNFPRLFAYILYVTGVTTIEGQVFVTTFTVGVAAIYFAYHALSRIVDTRFGFIAGLVLITDYVLIAQWQVVTYRVWHEFFVFSSMLCVQYFSPKRQWIVIATIVNFACLFYFELIFAAFVIASSSVYAALTYRKEVRRLLGFFLFSFLGAVLSVVILASQITLYMGWDNFLQDLRYTFLSRNLLDNLSVLLPQVQDFFDRNNVVFWFNFQDSRPFRTLWHMIGSIAYFDFAAHTPAFNNVMGILFVSMVIGTLRPGVASAIRTTINAWPESLAVRRLLSRLSARAAYQLKPPLPAGAPSVQPDEARHSHTATSYTRAGAGLLMLFALFAFLHILLWGERSLGFADGRPWWLPGSSISRGGLGLLIAIAVYLGMLRQLSGSNTWFLLPQPHVVNRLRRVATFLLLATALLLVSPLLFNQNYQIIFEEILSRTLGVDAFKCVLVVSVGLGIRWIVIGTEDALGPAWRAGASAVMKFVLAGLIGYAVVYFLSTGYVLSGYRYRFVPFATFHFELLVALLFYSLTVALRPTLGAARGAKLISASPLRERNIPNGLTKYFISNIGRIASGALLAALLVYWIGMQISYIRLLPPTHFEFLQKLSQPPLKGATSVVNTYAAPIAYGTGTWSYFHEPLLTNVLPTNESGEVMFKAETKYLWMLDKTTNKAYSQPQYFVCIAHQSLPSLSDWLRHRADPRSYSPPKGCEDNTLVKSARNAGVRQSAPPVSLVAFDDPGKENVGFARWAIVRFDWPATPP